MVFRKKSGRGWTRIFVDFLLLAVILLVGCSGEGETAVSPPSPTAAPSPITETATTEPGLTILAFGDSLTEGLGVDEADNYPSQLARKLQADGYNVTVINGGISGETTSSALTRVDWMLNTNPDIVIVETGANDALRGVDIALTRQNLDEIVSKFTAGGAVVVVAGMQIVQNLGEEYTTEFAAMYPAIAEKHDAILIPFVLEGVAANPDLNQPDFIHPTAAGYTVMVDHMYPYVVEAIAQALP